MESVNEREQGGNIKASTTSAASLSSSTSKNGLSCHSNKAEGRKRGRKRKAPERTSPRVQPPVPCKPPPIVRRLSADKSHFKDIVHQFTGLPCRPPPSLPTLSLCTSNILAAAISQSLQTLDTISAYLLLHGSSQENNILLNEINKSNSLTFLQALKQQDSLHKGTFNTSGMGTHSASSIIGGVEFKSSCPSTSNFGGVDLKSLFASHLETPPKGINIGMLGGQELPHTNTPSMRKSQQIAELKSVLLKDNNTPENLFSLAWVLLKQMASQPTPLTL